MRSDDRIGATLQGKYTLERVLGEGGMGIVYAARHLRLDRSVAIKLLHSSFARDDTVLARFFDEARAAGSLRHPHVIDILDVDVDGDTPFMVMEHLSGEPLSSLLERRGALPVDEALAIVDPLLDALAAAHDRGIVHRDLKPDNVFLAREGERVVPKLLDFGIAKLLDGGVRTETGNAIGTPMYMAPEQAAGRRDLIGPWTDVWSMGVVLFECLSGQLHFDAEPSAGMMAWLTALATQSPRSLAAIAPDLPGHVTAAVDAALEPDVSRRTQSARALRAALRGEAPSPEIVSAAQGPGADIGLAATVATPASQRVVAPSRTPRLSGDTPPTRVSDVGATAPPALRRARGTSAVLWIGALVGAVGLAAVAAVMWTGRTPPEPDRGGGLAPVTTETVTPPPRPDPAPASGAAEREDERPPRRAHAPTGDAPTDDDPTDHAPTDDPPTADAPTAPRVVQPPTRTTPSSEARAAARRRAAEARASRRAAQAAEPDPPEETAPAADSPRGRGRRGDPPRGSGRSKIRTRTGEWSTDEL